MAHHRQHIADGLIQALAKDLRQTRTFKGIVKARRMRIDIYRQAVLTPQVVEGILVGRENILRSQPQTFGQSTQEATGQHFIGAVVA